MRTSVLSAEAVRLPLLHFPGSTASYVRDQCRQWGQVRDEPSASGMRTLPMALALPRHLIHFPRTDSCFG